MSISLAKIKTKAPNLYHLQRLLCIALLGPFYPYGLQEGYQDAIKSGIRCLLRRQNPDGSWSPGRYYRARRLFREAITSICAGALLEYARGNPKVEDAVRKAINFLVKRKYLQDSRSGHSSRAKTMGTALYTILLCKGP